MQPQHGDAQPAGLRGAEKAAVQSHLCCGISLKSAGVYSKEKHGDISLYAIHRRASAAECRTPAPQEQKMRVMGESLKVKHQTWEKWDPGVSIKASTSEAEETRGILIKWVYEGAVLPLIFIYLCFSPMSATAQSAPRCWNQNRIFKQANKQTIKYSPTETVSFSW